MKMTFTLLLAITLAHLTTTISVKNHFSASINNCNSRNENGDAIFTVTLSTSITFNTNSIPPMYTLITQPLYCKSPTRSTPKIKLVVKSPAIELKIKKQQSTQTKTLQAHTLLEEDDYNIASFQNQWKVVSDSNYALVGAKTHYDTQRNTLSIELTCLKKDTLMDLELYEVPYIPGETRYFLNETVAHDKRRDVQDSNSFEEFVTGNRDSFRDRLRETHPSLQLDQKSKEDTVNAIQRMAKTLFLFTKDNRVVKLSLSGNVYQYNPNDGHMHTQTFI